MPPVKALYFAPSLADGHRVCPRLAQGRSLLLQKEIRGQHQGPEPQNGCGAHDLVLIQPQQFFSIAKKDFDAPPRHDVPHERGLVRGQIAGRPEAGLRQGRLERFTHNDHLAAIQLPHLRGHHMNIDRPGTRLIGPRHHLIVRAGQPGGVLGQGVPAPAGGRRRVGHPHGTVRFQTGGDEKPAPPRGLPDGLGPLPAIQQNLGPRTGYRLTGAYDLLHHLAPERDPLRLTDLLLPVQAGR